MVPHAPRAGTPHYRALRPDLVATRRAVRAMRLAAHVLEIVGANNPIVPSDIPLVLMRPVNKRDAHAAAAEITDIRRFRKRIYGTPATDHLTLDLDIELLRGESRWILNDRQRFWS